jgi:serine/threonine protein kinase
MQSAADDNPLPQRVGRYVVRSELGSGGMATVYLGYLTGPGGFAKTVAIKRLHPHLALEPSFVSMLIDEARLASLIHHANVVSALDVVFEEDELLLIMDYVQGETLSRLTNRSRAATKQPLPSVEVSIRIITDVLAGLHAAHSARTHGGAPLNIVHRDVSPQNVMVGVDGVTRVLDFGVAKAEHRRHSTVPGRIKGKLAYMSPEQLRGGKVDARTDVFAAGVILWECLTHRRLFAGDERPTALSGRVTAPSELNPASPRALDDVVLRALARDPDNRFPTAEEFARALCRVVEPASGVDVGNWVTSIAGRGLAERSRLLEELEVTTPLAPAIDDTRVDTPSRLRPAESETRTDTVAPTRLSVPTVIIEPKRRRRAPPWIGVAGIATLLGVAGLATRAQREPAPEPPAVEQRVAMAPAVPIVAPSPDPHLAHEISAPTQVDSVSANEVAIVPAVSAPHPRPTPSASPPKLEKTRVSVQPTSPKANAARADRRVPADSVPERGTPIATPSATAREVQTKPSCEQPYRVDERGIRRVRLECL